MTTCLEKCSGSDPYYTWISKFVLLPESPVLLSVGLPESILKLFVWLPGLYLLVRMTVWKWLRYWCFCSNVEQICQWKGWIYLQILFKVKPDAVVWSLYNLFWSTIKMMAWHNYSYCKLWTAIPFVFVSGNGGLGLYWLSLQRNWSIYYLVFWFILKLNLSCGEFGLYMQDSDSFVLKESK